MLDSIHGALRLREITGRPTGVIAAADMRTRSRVFGSLDSLADEGHVVSFYDRRRLEMLAQPGIPYSDEALVLEVGKAIAARREASRALKAAPRANAFSDAMIDHHDRVATYMTAYLSLQRLAKFGTRSGRALLAPLIEKHAMDFAYEELPRLASQYNVPTNQQLARSFQRAKDQAIALDLCLLASAGNTRIVARHGAAQVSDYSDRRESRTAAILADRKRGLATLP